MTSGLKKLEKMLFSLIEDYSVSSGSIINQILLTGMIDLQNKRKETLLMYSIYHNRPDIAYNLILNGSDVNIKDKNNNTALHYAVASDINEDELIALIDILIKKGADINRKNKHNKTPVMIAKELNRFKVLEILLEAEE